MTPPLRGIGFRLRVPAMVVALSGVMGALSGAPAASAQEELSALDAALSPDGRLVAFRATRDGIPSLFVMSAFDTLEAAPPLTPAEAAVGHYAWAPDSRHVVFTNEAGRGLRVVRFGGAGAAGANVVELVAETAGPVRIAGFTPDPLAALVELPGRWPEAPDLVQVPLGTGTRTTLVRNEGGVRRWIPDPTGSPRLGIRQDDDGGTELVRYREGELLPVYRCAADETCEPVGFHPDGRVWLRSDRGREAPALLLLDPLTSDVQLVRTDLSDDPRAVFREDTTSIEATRSVRDVVGEDATLTFHAAAAEGGRHLVAARGPERAQLLLLDRWAGVVEPILRFAETASPSTTAVTPDASALVPVRLGYRITEEGSRTPPIEMVRRIEQATEDGAPAWRVVDEAEVPTFEMPDVDVDMDGMTEDPAAMDDILGDDPSSDPFAESTTPTGSIRATDTVVLDGSTLAPLRRRAEGAVQLELDFRDGRVSGFTETEGFEAPVDVETDGSVWSDGAALETLVAALPLEEGYRIRVSVLETRTTALDTVEIAVRGTERATTPAGSFDTWQLTLTSSLTPDRREQWLVRRAAPHYVVRAETHVEGLVRIMELTDAGGLP